MEKTLPVTRKTCWALSLVSMATLMFEILLTRIFSVTMWYHFAFVAISLAMFGMTVGAVLVFVLPGFFQISRLRQQIASSALWMAVSIVVALLTHLAVPFFVRPLSLVSIYSMVLTYAAIAVPFVFSGICICLVLTRFSQTVSKLYAFDLCGAAIGCIALIYLLEICDGLSAVLVAAGLAALGAWLFALDSAKSQMRIIAPLTAVFLFALSWANLEFSVLGMPLLRISWAKGQQTEEPIYVKWNSFSRISITRPDPSNNSSNHSWSLSNNFHPKRRVDQLSLKIDVNASTVLSAFDGNLEPHEYLKYDVTNIAHHLRSHAKVLVIGVGGGRDLLSALVFKQQSVTGVEINQNIITAVNDVFGDFTGHLNRLPQVRFVNDEARSWISRQSKRFDILQISLIDTWAATAAGAFVLTENSLYTTEAWKIFLEHLTDRGILTVSRWHFKDRPGETYRLTSLATAALDSLGIRNPRAHILLTMNRREKKASGTEKQLDGISTVLVSRKPFSAADQQNFEKLCHRLGFTLLLTPDFTANAVYAKLSSASDYRNFAANYPINVEPPTDDQPFFFNMLRWRNIGDRTVKNQGVMSFNMQAVELLGSLFVVILTFTLLCIFGPLTYYARQAPLSKAVPLMIFFTSIGLGFMLVEISQMQRLNIFLGHPVYGLSVVLVTMLLASGLGSGLTARVGCSELFTSGRRRLAVLLLVLVVFGLLTPGALATFRGSATPWRILVSFVLLFPLGIFMGMAFPLGIKTADARGVSRATPWLWGINGAASVLASILAVVLALSFGIELSFWCGVACYLAALLAFLAAWRHDRLQETARDSAVK